MGIIQSIIASAIVLFIQWIVKKIKAKPPKEKNYIKATAIAVYVFQSLAIIFSMCTIYFYMKSMEVAFTCFFTLDIISIQQSFLNAFALHSVAKYWEDDFKKNVSDTVSNESAYKRTPKL